MPSRMTSKQWEAMLPEDKEVLNVLGILSLVKPKEGKKSKASFKLEPYILKRISTCRVCKTTFTKYFRMSAFPGKSFLISTGINQEDILPSDILKEVKDFCPGCTRCYKILSENSKEELIREIIRLCK